MKKIIFLLVFLFSVFAFSQDWKQTFAEAVATAKDQDKPIVLVFSGSDWCASCIKLDKGIWQSEEFIVYSKANYILYRADFPRKKSNKLSKEKIKENNELAGLFNSKGHFPLVVLLNSKEKVLGRVGYKRVSPKAYISLLNSFLN